MTLIELVDELYALPQPLREEIFRRSRDYQAEGQEPLQAKHRLITKC
jgi:hypothetical protein